MGTLRKKINGEWVAIASSQASEIGVKAPNLLPDGTSETNVEQVLSDFKGDIDLLKSNVSWLAKHGGGGSGGGSGSTIDTSCKIVVANKDSGSEVTLKDSVAIQVLASDSTSKWNLSVIVENVTLKNVSGITTASKTTITKTEIEKAGITKSKCTVSITATNPSTLQNVYWTGVINIATAKVSVGNFSFDFGDFDGKTILFYYSVGVLGRYDLRINNTTIAPGVELTTNDGEIEVKVSDLYEKLDLQVGSNTLTTRLINCDQTDIMSDDYTSYITIVTDTPVIQCTALSLQKDNPTPVYMSKGGVVVQVPYTVYYNGVSYKVKIYSNLDDLTLSSIDFDSINTYNSYNNTYPNGSYKLGDVDFDTPITIKIAIQDQSAGLALYEQEFFIITKKSQYDLLDNGCEKSLLFDYTAFSGIINNKVWTDKQASYASSLNIVNVNNYSSSIDAAEKMLRLQNTSYAVIKPDSGYQSFSQTLLNRSAPAFTLSISFKADFHPDDYRTIFQFANLYTEEHEYEPQRGIVIRDHMLYVGANTLTLEDDTLNNITISYARNEGETFGSAFVYIDGVPEAVFQIKATDIIPDSTADIYLACSEKDGKTMYYCDTNIYRVTMYNACLNPYQILYDYANTLAYMNPTEEGQIDASYIEECLKRNFVSTSEDGTRTSLLWSTTNSFNNNNSDFSDCFNVGNLVGGTPISLKDTLANYDIPIPLMLIDVSSADAWTWKNFITPNSGLNQVSGCRFQYLDQTQDNKSVITGYCNVSVQGTSTLADFIKNLNIEFSDNTVFIPRKNWFPETTYTLKADIVDSSHSLNASIGKFVNEELGLKYNDDGTLQSTDSWYPYSETVLESYSSQKKNTKSAISTYFPHASLKHGVEGFPVFVILQFAGGKTATLGIYQFILGRNSPRNLGYEIITGVEGMESDIIYPYYNDNVQITTTDIKGYWVEMTENNTFAVTDNFQELEEADVRTTKLTGAFWQTDGIKETTASYSHGLYYDKVAEIKYTNLGAEAVSSLYNLPPFAKFVNAVQQLPVTNRRYSKNGASSLARNSFMNIDYPKYQYQEVGTNTDWVEVSGEYNHIASRGDELNGILNDLNVESISKVFVIYMLYGLLDNFQKNMPLKFYQKKDGSWENAIIGIYDTDSGIGATNEADIKVTPYLWLCNFKNVDKQLVETSEVFDPNKVTNIIGNSNKLWYLDTAHLNYSMEQGWTDDGSIYTSQWYSLISKLGVSKLSEIVDLFMDKYFLPQTEGCGEILFNLTYFTKYLNKYEQNGTQVNQYSKLHGRRIAQVRSWLNKRVNFLDSLFTSMGSTMPSAQQTVLGGNVNLSTGSAPTFSLTTNHPMVIAVDSQGSNNQFVYMEPNVETEVYWGSSDVTSQQVSHTISYPDSIQKLGNAQYKLSDIYYQKISGGALPYLTEFDVSNCTKIESLNADGMANFKKDGKSELRIIDCTGTAKTSMSGFNFILNLREGFQKLQELNIRNSCVTQIELPTDPSIPIASLDVMGSQLTTIKLDAQNLLTTINLTNCSKLTELEILNCEQFKTLSLDKTQSSLKTVSINSDFFEDFTCIDNKSVTTITINSSSLRNVYITGCEKLTSVTINGTSLQSLNLYKNAALTYLAINKPPKKLQTLNLNTTLVSTIHYDTGNQFDGWMDLQCFSEISYLDLNNNTNLKVIEFANDRDNPFVLKSYFTQCPNLERIYGHVDIAASGMFSGCKKFSLFGATKETSVFMEKNTYDSENKKTIHPTESPSFWDEETNSIAFDDWSIGATNYTVSATSLASCFANTACTVWDIYYILCKIGPNTTNLHGAFQNIANGFDGQSENDSPHRKTFMNCGNVINANYLFYGSSTNIELVGPSVIIEDYQFTEEIMEDNGLMSPLVNLEYFTDMFSGSYYCSRHYFRRREGNYKFKTLSYFRPRCVLQFTETLKPSNILNLGAEGVLYYINSENTEVGDFSNFFENMPEIESIIASLDSMWYIDFDKCNRIIPKNVTKIEGSFTSLYSRGTLKIPELFQNPEQLDSLKGSFFSSNIKGDIYSTLYINNDTFKGMTNLRTIGLDTNSNNSYAFYGDGLIKVINSGVFPYSILSPCKDTIEDVSYLFSNIEYNEALGTVELPGTLFINTPNISTLLGTFSFFNNPYTLTSEGFKNCPNISNVREMFKNTDSWSCKMVGGIPKKFLFHGYSGEKTYSYTYLDPDSSIDPTAYYVEDGVTYFPEVPDDDIRHLEFTVKVPRSNIKTIAGCFTGINSDAYENENPEIENNPDYKPFKYYTVNDVWFEVEPNYKPYTYMWEFDGVNHPVDNTDNYQSYDDTHDENIRDGKTFGSAGTIPCSLNYIAPPDFLRYCGSATDLSSLFSSGRAVVNYGSLTADTSDYLYLGLKGRICPYMLKPVTSVATISNMFNGCTLISGYTYETQYFLIPKSFFKYTANLTNLESCWYNNVFNYNITLDVFSAGANSKKALSVANTFGSCMYNTTDKTTAYVGPIFRGISMYSLAGCFAVGSSGGTGTPGVINKQFITFDTVFDKNKIEEGKDTGVFSGYAKGYVTFKNPALRTDIDSGNYKYFDGTSDFDETN